MKIGILTHPLRFNYGGILQNYALQRVLLSYGHEVYTIDWNDDKSFVYKLLSYVKRIFMHYVMRKTHISTKFHLNLSRKQFLYLNEKNLVFIDRNINKTEYISSISQLYKVNEMGFDAIVVGSDQVWLEQFVPMMYLDFLKPNILRIAYAASFGKDEWTYNKRNTELASLYAKKFHAISVREESAVFLCSEYLGVSATWVLDPTLLLTSNQYDDVIDLSEDKSPSSPHIMTYILDNTSKKEKIVDCISSRYNLGVFKVEAHNTINGIQEKADSISTWLAGFKNADFVITDSFHGTVFSILYNKPFLVIGNRTRGMARFISLLKLLGLENRLIFETDDHSDILKKSTEVIDYAKVNELLDKIRMSSRKFLTNSLDI